MPNDSDGIANERRRRVNTNCSRRTPAANGDISQTIFKVVGGDVAAAAATAADNYIGTICGDVAAAAAAVAIAIATICGAAAAADVAMHTIRNTFVVQLHST